MNIYTNRVLDFKKIKAIGFDMDYTLVRYNSKMFETMAYHEMLKKLVEIKNYPGQILEFKFDYDKVIKGLVIDKKLGNLLKLSLFGKVKKCYHGSLQLFYKDTSKIYRELSVDVREERYESIDTTFSISASSLYLQLVDFIDSNSNLFSDYKPNYADLAMDIFQMIDLAHIDGSLKDKVKKNTEKYIIKDENLVKVLEKLKASGKSLQIITNSDYHYTKLLMDYTINSFLDKNRTWLDIFDLVITQSEKPSFFTSNRKFLKVNISDASMTNHFGNLESGVFQGGNSVSVEKYLGLKGDEILYLGDHIYGDVVTLKKSCNWRTALVVEEIAEEINAINKGQKNHEMITKLMIEKEALEQLLFKKQSDAESNAIFKKVKNIDEKISSLIVEYEKNFNKFWGPLMRAGQEPSRIANQIERYACIYMSKVSDLIDYSPRHYFRPKRRPLPHEA
ncbi:MAG: HAD-IG family 5'-nucleotidase [Pseudomonadota bacterium]